MLGEELTQIRDSEIAQQFALSGRKSEKSIVLSPYALVDTGRFRES
jgi:hypothetical protein